MKNIMLVIAALAVLTAFTGCSDDPPSVRVTNLRLTKANVQIKQANGNTINHNDVLLGVSSNFQDIAEGAVLVTAGIQNETVTPTTTFNASKGNNYTIVVLTGDPPALRVDQQEK
jgi:hypothetical protein